MCRVIPFPLVRRQSYVRKQASFLCTLSHPAAERTLRHQLELQRRVLLRRGITPTDTNAQVTALEAVIRAEVLRLSRGGVA